MNEHLRKFEDDERKGYVLDIVSGGVRATGYIITSLPYDEITLPYCYAEISRDDAEDHGVNSDDMFSIERETKKKVLSLCAEIENETGEWAADVLEVYKNLEILGKEVEPTLDEDGCWDSMKQAKFRMPDGETLDITFCYNKPFSEPEFITTEHPDIDCCNNILELAERIVNKDKEYLTNIKRKENLQQFYKERIAPLEGLPDYCLTDKQKEDLEHFSDRHKDIYGVRPRGIKNHCKYKEDYERD